MIYTTHRQTIDSSCLFVKNYFDSYPYPRDYISFKVHGAKTRIWNNQDAYVAVLKTSIKGVRIGWSFAHQRQIIFIKELAAERLALDYNASIPGIPRLLNRYEKWGTKSGLAYVCSMYD